MIVTVETTGLAALRLVVAEPPIAEPMKHDTSAMAKAPPTSSRIRAHSTGPVWRS